MASICLNTICDLNTNLIEVSLWAVEILILHSFYRRIERETPDHYLMLSEARNVVMYHFKYIVFRAMPIFLICLFNYKLLHTFFEAGTMNIFIFNLILVLVELLITNLSAVRKYWGDNLAYKHLFVGVLMFTIPGITHYVYPVVQEILPSTQGVIDSIWSALIIFSLYSTILFLSNKNNRDIEYYPEINQMLKMISKYSNLIAEQSLIHNANVNLVKAVAIYEAIQRPKFLRLLETVFVFFFKKPASQGIMQFTTDRVISDEESIILAVEKYFKNTSTTRIENFREIIFRYNSSERYVTEIYRIYWLIGGEYIE